MPLNALSLLRLPMKSIANLLQVQYRISLITFLLFFHWPLIFNIIKFSTSLHRFLLKLLKLVGYSSIVLLLRRSWDRCAQTTWCRWRCGTWWTRAAARAARTRPPHRPHWSSPIPTGCARLCWQQPNAGSPRKRRFSQPLATAAVHRVP